MPSVVDLEDMTGSRDLLGLIDYYEIVLLDKELIKKESEFRNHRLSLILEIIQRITIPEDLKMELNSAIIGSWRLRVPGSTREKRSIELNMVLNNLEHLRSGINSTADHQNPQFNWKINVAALHSLSLRRQDFDPKDFLQIDDLMNQARDHLEVARLDYKLDLATA